MHMCVWGGEGVMGVCVCGGERGIGVYVCVWGGEGRMSANASDKVSWNYT